MQPEVPISEPGGPIPVTQDLRTRIDVPQGWRAGSINRATIFESQFGAAAFERGFQILACHVIAKNYVCEVTRVEAGVFAVLSPAVVPQTVSQVDQLHWWAIRSDAHPPVALPPPLPEIDWQLSLLQGTEDDTELPPTGIPLPIQPGTLEFLPLGGVATPLWPSLRFGLISFAPHVVIVGPKVFCLVAAWRQPPPLPAPTALPYQLGQSWGILEGRDLRFDSEEARRLLIGGLT